MKFVEIIANMAMISTLLVSFSVHLCKKMRQGVAKPKNPFNFDKQNIFAFYGMRMIYLNVCPSYSAQTAAGVWHHSVQAQLSSVFPPGNRNLNRKC